MAIKKKESIGGNGKSIVFIIIGILIIFFVGSIFISSEKKDRNIDEINFMRGNYYNTFENFEKEYEKSDPYWVINLTTIQQEREINYELTKYILSLRNESDKIISKVDSINNNYKKKKLSWLNNISSCYDSELNKLKIYDNVINVQNTYTDFYESYLNFSIVYTEFNELVNLYKFNFKIDRKQIIAEDLGNIKQRVLLIKQYSEISNNAAPNSYYYNMTLWATKYAEGIDWEMRYWTDQDNQIKVQMNNAYTQAANIINNMTNYSISKDIDRFYIEKIVPIRKDALKTFYTRNQFCIDADNMFIEAFPAYAKN